MVIHSRTTAIQYVRPGNPGASFRPALLALALGCLLGANVLRAEESLPKGEAVLDKYIEATGGKAE